MKVKFYCVFFLIVAVSAYGEMFPAVRITVENHNAVECERPVVIEINENDPNYSITDQNDFNVTFQIDDLDQDGIVDELVFLSRNEAQQIRSYNLYSLPQSGTVESKWYVEGEDFDVKTGGATTGHIGWLPSRNDAIRLGPIAEAGTATYHVGARGLDAGTYYVYARVFAGSNDRWVEFYVNGSLAGTVKETLDIGMYKWFPVVDSNNNPIVVTTDFSTTVTLKIGGDDIPYIDTFVFSNISSAPSDFAPGGGYSPLIPGAAMITEWYMEGEDFDSERGDVRVTDLAGSSSGKRCLLANLAESEMGMSNRGDGIAKYNIGSRGLPPGTYNLAARLMAYSNDRSVNFSVDGNFIGKADETGIPENSYGWVWVKDANSNNVTITTDHYTQIEISRGGIDHPYVDIIAFMVDNLDLPDSSLPAEGFYSPQISKVATSLTNPFSITREKMGSWLPIHIPPTISASAGNQDPNLSPENKTKTLELLVSLEDRKKVLNVAFPEGQVTLGANSGLIEAMKPKAVIIGGSYLREYSSLLPNDTGIGELKLISQGPVRLVLSYESTTFSRQISIYRNGIITTKNTGDPNDFQIITSCYPYPVSASTTNNPEVRFSKFIENMYTIPDTNNLYLYQPGETALGINFSGAKPATEMIWADGGELAFEVALQTITPGDYDAEGYAAHLVKMGDICRSVIGGMVRLDELSIENNQFDINYQITNEEANTQEFFADLTAFSVSTQDIGQTEYVLQSSTYGDVVCEITPVSDNVTQLYPNTGYGWQLEPYTLSTKNPLPAFYDLSLSNNTASSVNVQIAIPSSDWIKEVVLADLQEGVIPDVMLQSNKIQFINDGNEYSVDVLLLPQESKLFSLQIQAREDFLGEYNISLATRFNSEEVSYDLSLTVQPNIIIHALFYSTAGDWWLMNKFGLNTYLDIITPWGTRVNPDGTVSNSFRDQLSLVYPDLERHGFFTLGILALNSLLLNTTDVNALAQFVSVYAADFESIIGDYFIAFYGHDEVWEAINRGDIAIADVITVDQAVIESVETPMMHTIMTPGIDAGLHKILPMDIPMSFHYSSIDTLFQSYATELRQGYMENFDLWKQDPGLLSQMEDTNDLPSSWFYISAQAHVTDYSSMRRQAWWLRENGYDGLAYYTFCTYDILYNYGAGVGNYSVMATNVKNGFILTDRAFAMLDIEGDMALLTELEIMEKKIKDVELSAMVQGFKSQAYNHSQLHEFDEAILAVKEALSLCKQNYYLEAEDFDASSGTVDTNLPMYDPSRADGIRLGSGAFGTTTYNIGAHGLLPGVYYCYARLLSFPNDRSVSFAIDGQVVGTAKEQGNKSIYVWYPVVDANSDPITVVTDANTTLTLARAGDDSPYIDVIMFTTTLSEPNSIVPNGGYNPLIGIPATCEEVISTGQELDGDINKDCYVNLLDLILLCKQWLICNNPQDVFCE